VIPDSVAVQVGWQHLVHACERRHRRVLTRGGTAGLNDVGGAAIACFVRSRRAWPAGAASDRASLTPFGDGSSLRFDAGLDRMRITGSGGEVQDELTEPRRSMAGYTGDTQWSATRMGYIISYATWINLLEPYLLTLPGVRTREIEPRSGVGETWRRLEVIVPRPDRRLHSYARDVVVRPPQLRSLRRRTHRAEPVDQPSTSRCRA
jgi:hypothetical protein